MRIRFLTVLTLSIPRAAALPGDDDLLAGGGVTVSAVPGKGGAIEW